MSALEQLEKEVREAIVFLREHNHTIPSETIEFMKFACLEKLNHPHEEIKTYCFDCWDRHGKTGTIHIVALTPEQAKLVFEHEYPEFGYDEPYT